MKIRPEKYDTPIKDRIRTFCSYMQMTDRDFQNKANLGEGFMVRASEPVCTAIGNIINAFPELSPDWLLTGNGNMLRNMKEHPSVVDISEGASEPARPYSRPAREMQQQNSKEFITLPIPVWEELRQQLKNKDDQIATLLTKLP